MRQHTGEKPLKCKTCNFSTRDPSSLHKHELRHNDVRMMKCTNQINYKWCIIIELIYRIITDYMYVMSLFLPFTEEKVSLFLM